MISLRTTDYLRIYRYDSSLFKGRWEGIYYPPCKGGCREVKILIPLIPLYKGDKSLNLPKLSLALPNPSLKRGGMYLYTYTYLYSVAILIFNI